ncbi:hypothetical protein AHF37_07394 [Paragonimus kellicotti]|nr:hypothetical protein AHF37_07394 [Paragonimus kellicotti]
MWRRVDVNQDGLRVGIGLVYHGPECAMESQHARMDQMNNSASSTAVHQTLPVHLVNALLQQCVVMVVEIVVMVSMKKDAPPGVLHPNSPVVLVNVSLLDYAVTVIRTVRTDRTNGIARK